MRRVPVNVKLRSCVVTWIQHVPGAALHPRGAGEIIGRPSWPKTNTHCPRPLHQDCPSPLPADGDSPLLPLPSEGEGAQLPGRADVALDGSIISFRTRRGCAKNRAQRRGLRQQTLSSRDKFHENTGGIVQNVLPGTAAVLQQPFPPIACHRPASACPAFPSSSSGPSRACRSLTGRSTPRPRSGSSW